MGVIIESLTPQIIGQRLGQSLYNQTGNLLLRKGVEINQRYFDFFDEKGYASILLLDRDFDEWEGLQNINSDRFLMTAPFALKRIFRKLKREENISSRQAKSELLSLAESLLVHIQNTLRVPPKIIEMKRQADYLYQHSVNVAVYSVFLGQKLCFQDSKLLNLVVSALLHDFGMEFVDDEIVNKTTKLKTDEFEKVKEHTTKGFSHLVRNCSFEGLTTVASVQHHERFDGGGYPKALNGESIHEYSRIITLSDFFDAWTSDRPHRRLNTVEDAMEFINANKKKIFDPQMVQYFAETLG